MKKPMLVAFAFAIAAFALTGCDGEKKIDPVVTPPTPTEPTPPGSNTTVPTITTQKTLINSLRAPISGLLKAESINLVDTLRYPVGTYLRPNSAKEGERYFSLTQPTIDLVKQALADDKFIQANRYSDGVVVWWIPIIQDGFWITIVGSVKGGVLVNFIPQAQVRFRYADQTLTVPGTPLTPGLQVINIAAGDNGETGRIFIRP